MKQKYFKVISDKKKRGTFFFFSKRLMKKDDEIEQIKEEGYKKRGRKKKERRWTAIELELLTIFTREGYNKMTKMEGRWGYSQGLSNEQLIKKLDYKGIFDGTVTENDKKKQISSKISSLKTQLQIPFVFRNKGLGRRRYLCAEYEKEFFKE